MCIAFFQMHILISKVVCMCVSCMGTRRNTVLIRSLSLSLSLSAPSFPSSQLVNKGMFMVSLISNKGILHRNRLTSVSSFGAKVALAKTLFLEQELPYHWIYLFICFFGVVCHEFVFVLLLVSCMLLSVEYSECYIQASAWEAND